MGNLTTKNTALLIYVVIALIVGLSTLITIIINCKKVGMNKTSQNIIGMPYDGEYASGFLGLFFLPSVVTGLMWPAIVLMFIISKIFK